MSGLSRLLTRITAITLGLLCILPGAFVLRSGGLDHGFDALPMEGWWVLMAAACVAIALGVNLITLRAISLSIVRHRSDALARIFCIVLGVTVFLVGLFGIYVFSQPVVLRDYVHLYGLTFLGLLLLYAVLFVMPGPYLASLRRLSNDTSTRGAAIDYLERERIEGEGPKRANMLSGLGLVILIAPAVAGTYADRAAQFVPNDAMYGFGARFGPVLGAAMVLVCIVVVLLRRQAEVGRRVSGHHMPTWAAVLFVALFGGAYLVFGSYVLSHGLPAVHALAVEGEPGTLRMTVVQKEPVQGRQRCLASVIAKGDGYGGPDGRRLCNLPVGLHHRVHRGDALLLEGRRTSFGFRFERITD